MVELLLELGADPTLEDYWGDTALHHVLDARTATLLLDHGAKLLAINSEGFSPLDLQEGEVASLLEAREIKMRCAEPTGQVRTRRI